MLMKDNAAQTHWFKRLVAFAIDAVIVFVALGIIAAILAIPFLVLSGPAAFGSVIAGAFSFVGGVILVIYFGIAEGYTGASLGKRIMGLKVVAEGGRNPNMGEAFLRNLSKIYWLLILLDVIVGLAVSKQYNQKYSDKFVGTTVTESKAA